MSNIQHLMFTSFLMSTLLWTGVAHTADKPRVVSLDFCADQLVLALAADEQIVALSPDAKKAFSFFRKRANKFPTHTNELDELLFLRPDLVFASNADASIAVRTLARQGVGIFSLNTPSLSDFSTLRLVDAGMALNNLQKAQLIDRTARLMLSDLHSDATLPVPGLYMSPSGITSGAGTFIDEVLNLAGIDNVVARQGIKGWSQLDLEILIVEQPQVIVTSFFDNQVGHQESWRFAAHPAVKKILKNALVIDVPSRLLSCSEWFALEGAVYIHDHLRRQQLEKQ